jgi:putative YphP/YqiW family bacilliredoxin
MMYDEELIAPMRQELTGLGIVEARTPDAVDSYLAKPKGTTLLVVNSVCGCAAANARPALAVAMTRAQKKPENAITVFAGNDRDATAQARSYLVGYPPSSPSIALFKDGEVVFMLERHNIAGRAAEEIGQDIVEAFSQYC